MFTFAIQKDTIRVEARDFGKEPAVAIKEEINRRYANKVIPEVGLCIQLLDIMDASEGAVLYGDGCYYYKTLFRLLVFRPFIGEAFLGKVQSQSEAGIVVSVGFFDDILIPPNLLPDWSYFDPSKQMYFWVYPPDPPLEQRPTLEQVRKLELEPLYIERKEWLRIRVEEERWADTSPGSGKRPPPAGGGPAGNGPTGTEGLNAGAGSGAPPPPPQPVKGVPPYSLICSMTEPGTGVLDWWKQDEDEEMGGES